MSIRQLDTAAHISAKAIGVGLTHYAASVAVAPEDGAQRDASVSSYVHLIGIKSGAFVSV